VALSGGVGGAKLVRGFSLAGTKLNVIVNTADDFEHLGLHISPDLDSVMYALADLYDPQRGWGLRQESWNALAMIEGYGAPAWFQLGDRDLATHVVRSAGLRQGKTLAQVTRQLCDALGIEATVLPMSDDGVHTQVHTPQGWLDFQTYFVKERCEPEVTGVRFVGIETAQVCPEALEALDQARLIVLCPSNPLVSLDPILKLPGMLNALQAASAPVVAVSPLIQGQAVKGPTVEMLEGMGLSASPQAVAQKYLPLLNGFVLDERDAPHQAEIEALGLRVLVTDTLMTSDTEKEQLAQHISNWRL